MPLAIDQYRKIPNTFLVKINFYNQKYRKYLDNLMYTNLCWFVCSLYKSITFDKFAGNFMYIRFRKRVKLLSTLKNHPITFTFFSITFYSLALDFFFQFQRKNPYVYKSSLFCLFLIQIHNF